MNLNFKKWLNLIEDVTASPSTMLDLIQVLAEKEALSPSALSDWPVAKIYKPFIYVAPNQQISESVAGTYVGEKNSSHDNLLEYIYNKIGDFEAKVASQVYNQLLNGNPQNGAVGRYAAFLNIDGLKGWYDLTEDQLNSLKKVKIISVYDGGQDLQNVVNDIKKREMVMGSDVFLVIGKEAKKV
jgi:hypothetical protein